MVTCASHLVHDFVFILFFVTVFIVFFLILHLILFFFLLPLVRCFQRPLNTITHRSLLSLGGHAACHTAPARVPPPILPDSL